ncbi:FliI/YscN family ATPase [Symbiobacterium terraclitae]|uniref:FliI/YscN family ATPase n=1 Tax=Symbiobacterium terraclitae TaxID=557451 RepID=UPI0035B51BE7
MSGALAWAELRRAVEQVELLPVVGRVTGAAGLIIESAGPKAKMNELCWLRGDGRTVAAEVVGFRQDRLLLMPLGETDGLRPGWEVVATGGPLKAPVGPGLLGRVIDGLGNPIDDKGPLEDCGRRPVIGPAPDPLARQRIRKPLGMGVRALDSLMTVGMGQRIGIFAGSGVGKSTLLGMVARATAADCNVIALVGERGREEREFIEKDLGEEGLRRSVVVVATSEQPSLVRIRAALLATTIAEWFRDVQGLDVILMMDSVTRLAQAQREVGLAVGEPPATRGYTPSVFSMLPRVLERSGTGATGSVTGVYTVLVDGDDMNEPVADAVRSILDGHVVLSRKLAHAGHYPAIDPLQSVSRVMPDVTTPEHRAQAQRLRALLAAYQEAEDLIQIGAYQKGTNPLVDEALAKMDQIKRFLIQPFDEPSTFQDALQGLAALCGEGA